jgi:hypothetical protein
MGLLCFMYDVCTTYVPRPSDSTVSEDVGIELKTVATLALTARRSNPQSTYIG